MNLYLREFTTITKKLRKNEFYLAKISKPKDIIG
jgi:hypothetical protein